MKFEVSANGYSIKIDASSISDAAAKAVREFAKKGLSVNVAEVNIVKIG